MCWKKTELQEIGWTISMMRTIYKLTKRTKTEKYKKFLRKNNILNFKTIGYKLTAFRNTEFINIPLEVYETS